MQLRRRIMAVAAVTAIIVPLALIAGSVSASATPDSSPPMCNQLTVPWACAQVFGNGLTIVQLNGWAHNTTAAQLDHLHIELYYLNGNGGFRFIRNCPNSGDLPPLAPHGNTANCTWAPNAPEAQGNYCAAVWQHISGSNYADLSNSCVGVVP